MEIAANKGECNENIGVGIAPGVGLPNEYKPVKTFEYGHSSNPNVKSIVKNFPPLSKNAIKKRNRKKNKLLRQQLPTLKGSHNSQQHQQQQSQQEAKDDADSAGNNVAPTALQNLAASMTSDSKPIETNIIPSRKGDKNVDLEDISDTDEIDAIENSNNTPAVPPPPSLSLTFQNSTDYSKYQLAIFPSTSSANEQVTKIGNAKHLQMSIPTMENCNTVAIDEILEKPGRLTRPKRICIILRGPPGCGKSYVAKLIKEKEIEMGGANPRILSIDDYFLIENDYEEKCSKTGKKIPKKEILYEYDDAMEETYMQYLIKSFKKTISDNLYDFIIVDCNNNSLRTLNDFYCHAKDSGFMPYIVDLFCDLETCLGRNPHDRSERDIKDVIDNWCETPFHYIKLNVSLLLENVVEMEDVENMATDEISNESVEKASAVDTVPPNTTADEGDDSNGIEGATQCGFLKSKWESDNTTESLERLDGTNKLQLHKRNTTSMADYLQLDDWQPRATSSNGKKRVRWADIEEKRKQEQMRAIGFVVGQTDWKRMMDPNAGNRALNRTKFIERVNKRQ